MHYGRIDQDTKAAAVYREGIYLSDDSNPARNVETHRLLANVQGEITAAARVCSVPVVIVGPQAWHSVVLGITRGRDALKATAGERAKEMGIGRCTQHEADALCVALYGVFAAGEEATA